MLATSERSSASFSRRRAARSPADTRATSTPGSNGTRITSSAPVASAARSSTAESTAAHTTTCADAVARSARTAVTSPPPWCALAITTCAWRSRRASIAAATFRTRTTSTSAAASTERQASTNSSSPSSTTRSPSLATPSSPRACLPTATRDTAMRPRHYRRRRPAATSALTSVERQRHQHVVDVAPVQPEEAPQDALDLEAAAGVEVAGGRVVGKHPQRDPAGARGLGLGDRGVQQRLGHAVAAVGGEDAQTLDLEHEGAGRDRKGRPELHVARDPFGEFGDQHPLELESAVRGWWRRRAGERGPGLQV